MRDGAGRAPDAGERQPTWRGYVVVCSRLDGPMRAYAHVEATVSTGTSSLGRPPTSSVRAAVEWALERADYVLLRDDRDTRPGTYYRFGSEPDMYSTQVRPGAEYVLWDIQGEDSGHTTGWAG